MQKLRIAILSYRSAKYGGGQGVYVRDISFALSLMGHDVDVISGPPYPDLHNGIKLIKLPGLDLFESFVFKDRLRKFLKKKNKNKDDFYEFFTALIGGFPEPKTFGNRVDKYLKHNVDYDVIIDNQSLSYGLLKIQKRFPLIEIIHHPITFDYKFELASSNKIRYKISRHLWYRFLKMQIKVASKLTTIITPSKSSKIGIMEEFKCDKDSIFVVNNGLDTNEFSPIPRSKRNKNRLITTASADVPLKGLDYSLNAIKILKEKYPDIHLIVIGDFKKGGHTERLIQDLGIKENVFFKKNISKAEICELYSSSSIAIVSSLYEGFGYPVIEAMSCEVPLIATDVSSIPELVGDFAKLVKPKDSKQISDAVKEILLDYENYKVIAENGRQHIIDKFNWPKITRQYEDVILKTIQNYKNVNF